MHTPVVHEAAGSVPSATGPQVPSAPVPFWDARHDWQLPVQALVQQTPPEQKPESQSAPVAQAFPVVLTKA
jgi:hypothetical protein